ncbi:C-type natriuretic peptide 1-like [Xenopus laevis]|uniref:C-type natriuretic peptide n=2 Tax=Xenopus laevis TaxID=8355 RepID=A0A974CFF7_XENLA|nr:C-type natriuretic peptide 1-like [Xenopus laevis]OCT72234.1 hypothetical protein XELAEV_18035203mg [Xenopus laevis]
MSCKNLACLGFLVMLVLGNDHVRAKPMSSLQSVSRKLEDNFEHSFGSEEEGHEKGELLPSDSLDQQDLELQWLKNKLDQVGSPQLAEIALQQLLNDPSSRRYRLRSKKGFSRGCFGMKLDRIGSLSGLGC